MNLSDVPPHPIEVCHASVISAALETVWRAKPFKGWNQRQHRDTCAALADTMELKGKQRGDFFAACGAKGYK